MSLDVPHLWSLVQIPVRNSKTSIRGCTAVSVWHKGGFRALRLSLCPPPEELELTQLCCHQWWDRTKTRAPLLLPGPKALGSPCPNAQISTVQRRQGRKEIPLCSFYRGTAADFRDCQILGLRAGLLEGVGDVWHRDSHQGGFRVLNTHQHSTDQNYSQRSITGCFWWTDTLRKLGCVSGWIQRGRHSQMQQKQFSQFLFTILLFLEISYFL